MIIRRLNIRNFGKIHDRTLEFSPGINVLYGENESGKTTVHTFIKSMLFGLSRMRGKAARNDVYSTYEPWENPVRRDHVVSEPGTQLPAYKEFPEGASDGGTAE